MPTSTTTYGLQKPVVGGDTDTWGGHINDNLDKLDDVLDGTLPVTPASGKLLEIRTTEAATATVTDALRLNAQSSGTPAAGIGVGLEMAAETAAGNTEIGAVIEAVATNVTAAAENFDLVVRTMSGGAAAAERLRVTSAGAVNMVTGGLQRAGVNAYALRSVQYLASGTAATYTPPANLRALRVTAIGGGGGGGGVDGQGTGTAAAGGGGGAGGMTQILITSVAASYTYTIGAGGAGGVGLAGGNGGAGGETTFAGTGVSLTASGGAGGLGVVATGTNQAGGGAGGAASGGALNVSGNAGARGRVTNAAVIAAGVGGSSMFGALGSMGNVSGSDGATAGGYGAGGGGAAVVDVTTNYAGGAGAPGLIIIEELF